MKAIIIGGGISGLTALTELKEAGMDVLLLEKGDDVGGSIKTFYDSGFVSESGPNALQINTPELESFIRQHIPEQKIYAANAAAEKRFLVRRGKPLAAPSSPFSAVFSPLLSFPAKCRVLAEPFIRKPPGTIEEDLATFTKRRLGREFLDYTINPMVSGVYAGRPELLSVKHGFPKVYALEQNYGSLIRGAIGKMRERIKSGSTFKPHLVSFEDGMQSLAKTLAKKNKEAVRLHATVNSIARTGNRWVVTWNNADGKTESDDADHVILACAVRHFADIALPDEIKKSLLLLNAIPHPPVTSVTMGFRRETVIHPLDGFGMLIPECEKLSVLGTLFMSSLFPRRAPSGHVTLTSFIGGMRNPDLALLPDEELNGIILSDLGKLLGVTSAPVFTRVIRHKAAIPQYIVGYGTYLHLLDDLEKHFAGLHFIGQYREGISVSYCIQNARRRIREMIAKMQ